MIIVNARFLTQKTTGVQRFAIEISLELRKLFDRTQLTFVSPRNIIDFKIAERLNTKVFGLSHGHFWEQVELPLYLLSVTNPILINLTNSGPILFRRKITTFCDISPITNPEWYSKQFALLYNYLYPRLVKTSYCILTISQFCKDEITDVLRIEPRFIHVISCSIPSNFVNYIAPKTNGNFLLCVSSLNPRKNFDRVIKAFLQLNEKDIKLFIVGEKNSNFSNTYSDFISSNIIFLGRVSDEELATLYSSAIGFIFVSLYEGFGIPPLEAQAFGCPVLASNISVHREILGDSALYCDPYDVIDIAASMKKLIYNDLNHLVDMGRKNVDRYSWAGSARKLSQIISLHYQP
jgi:glycosyltransferase involved in cell wall biosynthesis